MPSEVSTVIGNQSLEELRRELTESREQQTATAEILSVISNSPTNAQRVFAAIATSAARLCAANDATIHKVDGGVLRLVGHHGPIPAESTLPPIRGILVGRAVLDRRTLHVGDLPAERTEYPEGSDSARRLGFRTVLGVPLIRAGQAIGAIAIRRTEARPFSDRQISLLKTFADQAVIAIENTRLFEEVQRKNDALTDANTQLTESLDQQTATGEILGVISRSPTDVQPVFGAIARSVVRLCNGEFAFVLRFDGEHLHFAASHGLTPEGLTAFQNALPRPAGEDTASGRAILQRDVVQIPDIQADPVYGVFGVAQAATYRSLLAAPLLRDGDPVGTIAVGRAHSGPFPESHIRLMRAFADQAVIAIENARLFEEVQQKNAALTASNTQLSETLEQQTATSMILRVISGSWLCENAGVLRRRRMRFSNARCLRLLARGPRYVTHRCSAAKISQIRRFLHFLCTAALRLHATMCRQRRRLGGRNGIRF
jgi:two-component system, NtrC family, sensor kinase